MTVTDELLQHAARYAAGFPHGDLGKAPARRLAVVACMDARLDPYALLGLAEGDAHVIRNAGGAITADALRSLAISQRALGTEAIVLIHHTDCGMHGFDHDRFGAELEAETGERPSWSADDFTHLDDDVRRSLARVRACPFLPRRDDVRGFVFDVATGALREVL